MNKKLNILLFSLVSIVCLVFVALLCVNNTTKNIPIESDNLEINNQFISVENNKRVKLGVKRLANTSAYVLGGRYQINATVYPDNEFINTDLTWSFKWNDGSELTTHDYSVDDDLGGNFDFYYCISENTHSIDFYVMTRKSTQLLITCSSVDNPNITATCTINFYKHVDLNSYSCIPTIIGFDGRYYEQGGSYETKDMGYTFDSFNGSYDEVIISNITVGDIKEMIGTVDTTVDNFTIDISLNDEFYSYLLNTSKVSFKIDGWSYNDCHLNYEVNSDVDLSVLDIFNAFFTEKESGALLGLLQELKENNFTDLFKLTLSWDIVSAGDKVGGQSMEFDLIGFNYSNWFVIESLELDNTDITM